MPGYDVYYIEDTMLSAGKPLFVQETNYSKYFSNSSFFSEIDSAFSSFVSVTESWYQNSEADFEINRNFFSNKIILNELIEILI